MSSRVTFVHAADLHLDAPFAGIVAANERVGTALAEATYTAFVRIVDVCIERSAHFLIIAGDAYNTADKSLRAQLAFHKQMERLAAAGVEVFITHGNHDPANGWSAGLGLPESVHVFPADRVGRVEVVRDGELIAAVYGRSFRKAAETENLALGYRREGAEPVAIAMLHANVGSNTDYDPYAPATLADLRSAGMDYWALGHIHKQEVLARDPWIVYAGSAQGLSPKETGPHGCLVVEIAPGGAVSVEHVETAPVAWAQLSVDVSEAATLEEVRASVASACERTRADAGRNAIVRITLTGRTLAHADLVRPGVLGELAEFVRDEEAAAEPWVWLDRLEDRTAAPIDLASVRAGGDFAAELVRVADDLADDNAALETLLGEICRPIATTLSGYAPHESASEFLVRARDLALDLLMAEGGAGR
ncbi:MAG: DNA repair exonuclease [Coriobacteriia bacterium]|nr:DNA repair exonuclease [Coriobacteriia bacterium]